MVGVGSVGGSVWAYGVVSQRRIRARSDAMAASRSFLAVAARRVALRTEVVHCSISIGDPLSSLASILEKSSRSWESRPALPFLYKS